MITPNCEREDCRIQKIGSKSTLLGWTPTYDKYGNQEPYSDNNKHSDEFKCFVCGKQWIEETYKGRTLLKG